MKAITRTEVALKLVLVMCFATACCFTCSAAHEARNSWNPKAAATYLDKRAEWWMSWPGAARDRETFCISCHTALPYALSRSALRGILGEKVLAPGERRIVENVVKRVRLWTKLNHFIPSKSAPTKLSSHAERNPFSTR
jgi:squalene-hopene/tetraprenyl-beta-curcumene cyclase